MFDKFSAFFYILQVQQHIFNYKDFFGAARVYRTHFLFVTVFNTLFKYILLNALVY